MGDVADLIWPRIQRGMSLDQVGKEVLERCCARGCRGRPMEEGTDNETIVLVKLSSPMHAQDQDAEDSELHAGQRVQIHGLESEAGKQINGEEGIVEGRRGDRFAVCLSNREVKAFKASNLRVMQNS